MSARASKSIHRRSRPARAGLLTTAAAAVMGLSLIASGCGGSSGTPVAHVGSTATNPSGSPSPAGSKSGDPAAFSACMRKHGVPNFPDPDSHGQLTIQGGSGLNPRSSQFQSAQKACRKLLPNGGQPDPKAQAAFLKQALKFSQCMRSHGLPNFPDPKPSGGGVGLVIGKNSGLDPNSPQFKTAQQACKTFLPGQGKGLRTSGGAVPSSGGAKP